MKEGVDEQEARRLAALLLGLLDAAEAHERGAACLGRREPSPDVLGCLPLDVEAKLLVDLAIELVPAKARPHATKKFSEHG